MFMHESSENKVTIAAIAGLFAGLSTKLPRPPCAWTLSMNIEVPFESDSQRLAIAHKVTDSGL